MTVLAVLATAPAEAGRRANSGPGRLEPADSERSREEDAIDDEAYKQFRYGARFYEQGLLAQAQQSLRQAVSLKETYPEAHYVLGLVALELNDFRAAQAAADQALVENPFFTEAHNLLGLIHARAGRPDDALREFALVLADASFPTPEVAHFNIGRVAWERQAFGEAILHFRRALAINSTWGRAAHMLGDCQEQLGQVADARETYQKAVELMPSEPGPLYRLGVTCLQLGDRGCAQASFERVRTMAPASPEADAAREQVRQMNFR